MDEQQRLALQNERWAFYMWRTKDPQGREGFAYCDVDDRFAVMMHPSRAFIDRTKPMVEKAAAKAGYLVKPVANFSGLRVAADDWTAWNHLGSDNAPYHAVAAIDVRPLNVYLAAPSQDESEATVGPMAPASRDSEAMAEVIQTWLERHPSTPPQALAKSLAHELACRGFGEVNLHRALELQEVETTLRGRVRKLLDDAQDDPKTVAPDDRNANK